MSRRESAVAQLSTLGGITFMSISLRRRLGLLLACISVLVLVVAEIFFSHSRVVGSGTSSSGSTTVTWTALESESDLGWWFCLPVLSCGVIGVLCLAWPPRKPPKL